MRLEEVRELLPLYALQALPEDEQKAVEQALIQYPELLSELKALEETASDLTQAIAKTPRPELKAKVMARIKAESPQSSSTTVLPLPRSSAKPKVLRTRSLAWVAAAAAVFLVAWGGNFAYRYYSWIQAFLDPATRVETLVDENKKPVGRAIYRADGKTLVWAKLPPPPPGKTYQLWGVNQTDHLGLDTFKGGLVEFDMPKGYSTVQVTEEQAGGSKVPTQIRALPEGGQ